MSREIGGGGGEGSDQGVDAARAAFARALRDPAGDLRAKIAARDRLAQWSRVSLPGDRLLQDAIDWGKQNLADLKENEVKGYARRVLAFTKGSPN